MFASLLKDFLHLSYFHKWFIHVYTTITTILKVRFCQFILFNKLCV